MSIPHELVLLHHFYERRSLIEVLLIELMLFRPVLSQPHGVLLHHGIVPLDLLLF